MGVFGSNHYAMSSDLDLPLCVKSESGTLRRVILGIAEDILPPTVEQTYDPTSLQHLLAGDYPTEEAMVTEMEGFREVLEKYHVQVLRPHKIPQINQIFARDVGFVIDDCFVRANMIVDRRREIEGIQYLVDQFDRVLRPPLEVRVEGGDVLVWHEHIFMGVYRGSDFAEKKCARTNEAAVDFLRHHFPHKTVWAFPLYKDNTDPSKNGLHLDCCFQPLGPRDRPLALLYRQVFADESVERLVEWLGEENILFLTTEEVCEMMTNVFSISETVVVSERSFTRVNEWLEARGLTVERIPFKEVGKQGGLLRCSTLPLTRDE